MIATFVLLLVGLIKRVAAIRWTARRMTRKVGEKRSVGRSSPSGASIGKGCNKRGKSVKSAGSSAQVMQGCNEKGKSVKSAGSSAQNLEYIRNVSQPKTITNPPRTKTEASLGSMTKEQSTKTDSTSGAQVEKALRLSEGQCSSNGNKSECKIEKVFSSRKSSTSGSGIAEYSSKGKTPKKSILISKCKVVNKSTDMLCPTSLNGTDGAAQEKMRKKVSFDLSKTPTGNCCSNESKALKCSSKLKARSSSVGFTLSMEGKKKADIFWLRKPPIEREFYAHEYKTGGRKGWKMLFKELNVSSISSRSELELNFYTESMERNRYSDVLPYKENRVKLCNADNDYINASFVSVEEVSRHYILTQSPMENTTSHFWQMVWEQQSVGIVMLCKCEEDGKDMCTLYWPTVGDSPIISGCYVVECTACEWKDSYCISSLKLHNLETDENRMVLHFHYFSWPDFGVPQNPLVFLEFLMDVRRSGVMQPGVGPVVVHCSSGVGRSGVFSLTDACVSWMEGARSLETLDVRFLLLHMRKQRLGLIQTPLELRFAYVTILNAAHYALELGQSISDLQKEVENFTETLIDEEIQRSSPKWVYIHPTPEQLPQSQCNTQCSPSTSPSPGPCSPSTSPSPGPHSPSTSPSPGPHSPSTSPSPGPRSPSTSPSPGPCSPSTSPSPGPCSPSTSPSPGPCSLSTSPSPGPCSLSTSPSPGPCSPSTSPSPGPCSLSTSPSPGPCSPSTSPSPGPHSPSTSPSPGPHSPSTSPSPGPRSPSTSPSPGPCSPSTSPSPGPCSPSTSPSPGPCSLSTSPSPGPCSLSTSPSPGPCSPSTSPSPGPCSLSTSPSPGPCSPSTSPSPGPRFPSTSPSPGPHSPSTSPSPGPCSPSTSPSPGPCSPSTSPSPGPCSPSTSPSPGPCSPSTSPSPGPCSPSTSPSPGPCSPSTSPSPGPCSPSTSPSPGPCSPSTSPSPGPCSPSTSPSPGPCSPSTSPPPGSCSPSTSGPCSPSTSPSPDPCSPSTSHDASSSATQLPPPTVMDSLNTMDNESTMTTKKKKKAKKSWLKRIKQKIFRRKRNRK